MKNKNGFTLVELIIVIAIISVISVVMIPIITGVMTKSNEQNGKIVGAVTHVFVNDPLGGYGIFASTMLNEIKRLS